MNYPKHLSKVEKLLNNAPSQLAGCEAAKASKTSMNPMSFIIGLLLDWFLEIDGFHLVGSMITHRYSPREPFKTPWAVSLAGSGIIWSASPTLWWRRSQNACLLVRAIVEWNTERMFLTGHRFQRVARPIAALFLFCGEMQGIHFDLLFVGWFFSKGLSLIEGD